MCLLLANIGTVSIKEQGLYTGLDILATSPLQLERQCPAMVSIDHVFVNKCKTFFFPPLVNTYAPTHAPRMAGGALRVSYQWIFTNERVEDTMNNLGQRPHVSIHCSSCSPHFPPLSSLLPLLFVTVLSNTPSHPLLSFRSVQVQILSSWVRHDLRYLGLITDNELRPALIRLIGLLGWR